MQFDVHRNVGLGADQAPYLLVVQSDRVKVSDLRVVVPLIDPTLFEATRFLNPTIDVEGRPLLVSTGELFAINRRRLGPVVGNVHEHRDAIVRALDLLFTGV